MNHITLKKIDESNLPDAFHLTLGEGQDAFVSHPIRSLAQAYVYYWQCTPFGIYCGETMVGYVMVIYDYDLSEYNIWHMMIDAQYQGQGYGKQAMEKCLEYIASRPFGPSNRIVLTCNTQNTPALGLYTRFGFVKTGNQDGEEIELALHLAE